MVKSLLNNLVFTQFTPLESPVIYGGDIEKMFISYYGRG